jgi:hypothetical protein
VVWIMVVFLRLDGAGWITDQGSSKSHGFFFGSCFYLPNPMVAFFGYVFLRRELFMVTVINIFSWPRQPISCWRQT